MYYIPDSCRNDLSVAGILNQRTTWTAIVYDACLKTEIKF